MNHYNQELRDRMVTAFKQGVADEMGGFDHKSDEFLIDEVGKSAYGAGRTEARRCVVREVVPSTGSFLTLLHALPMLSPAGEIIHATKIVGKRTAGQFTNFLIVRVNTTGTDWVEFNPPVAASIKLGLDVQFEQEIPDPT